MLDNFTNELIAIKTRRTWWFI